MDTGRENLWSMLGDLPDATKPVNVLESTTMIRGNYIVETLLLDLNGLEPVPAYYIKPVDQKGPFPTILFNHSHGGFYDVGKDELLNGAPYMQVPPYAEVLTEMGYAVCCIDAWAFGERSTESELTIFKKMLWSARVMWGMMVFDNLRALDYLFTREDVDTSRIATLGMSMGGTMAWWCAALDERIKVCIDICSLADYQSLIDTNGLSHHGIYYYVHGLLKHFTTADINSLIAPRPHLGLAGNLDVLTPADGLDKIDQELSRVYSELGVPDAWRMVRCEVAHVETEQMRSEAVNFLKSFL